jgi:hypothetical protein
MKKDDKKIEAFIDKLMSADRLEQPSIDFTANVMSKVEAIYFSTATVYKPLIPKFIWFIILGSFVALVGYIYLKEPVAKNVWFNRLDLSNISLNLFENTTFGFSATFMSAVVFLAIMVSIQVPLLKYYFNKRMSF